MKNRKPNMVTNYLEDLSRNYTWLSLAHKIGGETPPLGQGGTHAQESFLFPNESFFLGNCFLRGGGVKAKTKKSAVLQQIFIQKALSQKREVRGRKSMHFPKALFKTYSKINV